MPVGGDFERNVVKAFNAYFEEHGIRAFAYRNVQLRYRPQGWDIYVDSRDLTYYLAIECKSIVPRGDRPFNFKEHFRYGPKGDQIMMESDLLRSTGRTGVLALEVRNPELRRAVMYMVDWRLIRYNYVKHVPSLPGTVLTQYPSIVRRKGRYEITTKFMTELSTWLSSSDRYSSRVWRAVRTQTFMPEHIDIDTLEVL